MAGERDTPDPWEHGGFDEDFVRAAQVHEDDWKARQRERERLRRRRARADRWTRRRRWVRKRAPELVLIAVAIGLVVAGIADIGPAARLFHTQPSDVATDASSPATTRPPLRSSTTSTATVSGPAGSTVSAVGGTGTTSTTYSLTRRGYQFGDCVRWDQDRSGSSRRDTEVVPCDQPHLVEIGGSIDLNGRFDHYPTEEEWSALYENDCAVFTTQLLGGPWDPSGRFQPAGLSPLPDSWAYGDRTLWCGMTLRNRSPLPGEDPLAFRPDVPKWFPTVLGTVRSTAQALVRPPGTCVTDEAFSTPCTEPHTAEITGSLDLTGKVSVPPAGGDTAAWSALVGDACRAATVAYLQRALVPGESIYHYPISPESWAAGRRVVECAAGRKVGGAEQPMTGSLRDAR
ncbi:MAG: septum formation family protein [Acidimicrobiales bacterium]